MWSISHSGLNCSDDDFVAYQPIIAIEFREHCEIQRETPWVNS
jgi:hypothetical protein